MRHGEIILAEYTSNENDMLKVDANGKIVVSTLNEDDIATVTLVADVSGNLQTQIDELEFEISDLNRTYYTSAETSTTTSSITDVVISGTTISPSADGDYLVFFQAHFTHSSAAERINSFTIYANGSPVTESKTLVTTDNKDHEFLIVVNVKIFGLVAGQDIDVRWNTTANTMTIFERKTIAMKVI